MYNSGRICCMYAYINTHNVRSYPTALFLIKQNAIKEIKFVKFEEYAENNILYENNIL